MVAGAAAEEEAEQEQVAAKLRRGSRIAAAAEGTGRGRGSWSGRHAAEEEKEGKYVLHIQGPKVLRDKINSTMKFGEQFPETSPRQDFPLQALQQGRE